MIFLSTWLFLRGIKLTFLRLSGGWWGLITLPILYGFSQWVEYEKNNVIKEYIAQSICGKQNKD